MDGEYVAHVEKSGDTVDDETLEQVFYPINDHLGQPFMMLRADIKLSHEQYTDPFGRMHAQYLDKSVGVDGVGAMQQNRRFPGQYYDLETGYSQNGYRDYDSSTGRELQPDPRGILLDFSDPERQVAAMMGIAIPASKGIGYLNHNYVYAGNNPVMNTDPTGEDFGTTLAVVWAVAYFSHAGNYIGTPEGNTTGGLSPYPQDNVCSSVAYPLNSSDHAKECCIQHDNCYAANNCNQTSWLTSALGGTKSCNQCNSDVVGGILGF